MKTRFFTNKTILITGGTGSIGSEILRHLLFFKPKKIRVFSRDEYKQYQLKFNIPANKYTEVEYILGDIRDFEAISLACQKTDIIFHCAAFKHVPQSEEMPEEFIKTNILGSINVKKSAIVNRVKTVVSISSDKAVNPSNVMGLTKAIQEKIFTSHYLRNKTNDTRCVNVRFGNVIGTKGSLFPILYHQIVNKSPLTVTHPDMTRFFMTKKDAIDLIFWSAINGKNGEVVIKKMKSAKLGNLINMFLSATQNRKNYPVVRIGFRVGEKMHESLITEDEIYKVKNRGKYYIVKPYSEKEIQKNIILYSQAVPVNRIRDFCSDNKNNFFTDREVKSFVKEFINEIKNNKQVL